MHLLLDQIESLTFELGKVVKIHGVNGRLVVRLETAADDLLDFPEWLFIRIDGGLVPFAVEMDSVFQKDSHHLVLGLEKIVNPEQAAAFVGLSCKVEGTWEEWFEVSGETAGIYTGFSFTDETTGKKGRVTGFEDIPGNPLLVLEMDGKNVLLPVQPEFILSADVRKKNLLLRIPEGLADIS